MIHIWKCSTVFIQILLLVTSKNLITNPSPFTTLSSQPSCPSFRISSSPGFLETIHPQINKPYNWIAKNTTILISDTALITFEMSGNYETSKVITCGRNFS
jgi:hypothetical protein